MAMRGDDVIGMILDPKTQRLRFLRTEAKSRAALKTKTLNEARAGLDKDGLSRCSCSRSIAANVPSSTGRLPSFVKASTSAGN